MGTRVYSLIGATTSTCDDQQKWTAETADFDFGITRTEEDVRIEKGTDVTQKIIEIDYKLADPRYKDVVNMTMFNNDCLTPVGSDVLPFGNSSVGNIVTLGVTYNPNYVESSDIWNPTLNGAGDEIGGTFIFCARAAVVDVQSGYEMDYNETKFFVDVSKSTGAGFQLSVDIDRDDAGEEDAGDVDHGGSVRGFQCDVDSFSEDDVAFAQGSSLGLCVESTTTGIIVAGWQTLTLSRDGFDFRAIENGVVPAALSNLVNPDCDSTAGHCVSEVELVALFFGTDGALAVDGTVVLGFTNSTGAISRRRLAAKVHAEIKQSKNDVTYSSR